MLKTCTIPAGKRQVNGYLEEKIILDLNTETISRLRRVGLLKGVKRVFGSNIIETERPLSLRGIIPITDLLAFISGIIKMPKNNLFLKSFFAVSKKTSKFNLFFFEQTGFVAT